MKKHQPSISKRTNKRHKRQNQLRQAGAQRTQPDSLSEALCRCLPERAGNDWQRLSYTACLSQGDKVLLYARSRADAQLLAAVLTGREWAEVAVRAERGWGPSSCLLICELGKARPVPVLAIPRQRQGDSQALAALAADVMQAACDQPYGVMSGELEGTLQPSPPVGANELLAVLVALLQEDWPHVRRYSAKQLAAHFSKTYRIPSLYRNALQEALAQAYELVAYEEKYPQLVRAGMSGEEQRQSFAKAYNASHMSAAERFWRRVRNDMAAIKVTGGLPPQTTAFALAYAILPGLDTHSLTDAYLALAALALLRQGLDSWGNLPVEEGPLSFFQAMEARWQPVWSDGNAEPGMAWEALRPLAEKHPQAVWQRALAAKRDFDEAAWPTLQETLEKTQIAWDAGKLRLTVRGCEPGWCGRREFCEQALAKMRCALLVQSEEGDGQAEATAVADRLDRPSGLVACFRYPEQAASVAAAAEKLLKASQPDAPSTAHPENPEAAWSDRRLTVQALPQDKRMALPRFGIYDVADGMHLLLAVCWDEAVGRELVEGFQRLKQREHRLAYLSERREHELRVCQAEFSPVLRLQEGFCHPTQTLYEEMAEFIRAHMATSHHTPADWEDRYLASCPLGRENRKAVRRLFRLVWGRLSYEAHYAPLQVEADEEKRTATAAHTYFAVAKGWEIGLFQTAEEARRAAEGFPHALACEFSSKGTAEAWLGACSWPRGKTIRYTVFAKGRQFTVEAREAAAASSAAGRVLYESDELGKVLAWLRAQRQSEHRQASAQELPSASTVPAVPKAHAPLLGHGPLSPAMMTPVTPEKKEKAASGGAEAAHAGQADGAGLSVSRHVQAASGEAKAQHGTSLFRGIQFDKHIFRQVPRAYQERFRKSFLPRLRKMERIFTGERQAAGNDFKLVAGARGKRVFKRRIGDHRLSMVYQDGILTLLALSSHDRQMVDIRKIRGKSIGYVYYDVDEFVQQLDAWQTVHEQDKGLSFGEYLATPQHFVYDEVQQSLLKESGQAETTANLSIVGNAGAGKSVVGLKWIQDEMQKPGQHCLYLTMSENLVYTLAYEFRQAADACHTGAAQPEIMTTFDFLRHHVKERYPRLPERCLLNAAQSLAVFRRFWQEQVDWRQFWPAEAPQQEEATLLMAWREIHGIIKGAARVSTADAGAGAPFASAQEFLDEEEYQQRLMREKKASRRDALWVRALYRVFDAYQAYLKRHGLLDDNDMASLIWKAEAPSSAAYTSAFIDECQDLTQRELLAIFKLLHGTRAKRLASDRCQMVQPTYFQESWMRTTLNHLDAKQGRTPAASTCRPRYLRYNYRSSRRIIAFQDDILQYFRKHHILTFKEAELQQIQVPPLTPDGWKPVWILPSAKNRLLLTAALWRSLEPGSLMPIFAFAHAETQKRFGVTAEDTVTDVLSCKGMEYPAVLLCDILSDMAFDPAMAWKYFYVGATRANRGLLLYEEDAIPGSPIHTFLQEAVQAGRIDCAGDLEEESPYQQQTWLTCLKSRLAAGDQYERLETAERALDFGQYELALNIYMREDKDPDMIAYCQAKVLENRGDFPAALQRYAAISPDWNDRGRSRSHGAAALLQQPDIEGPEFIAAFLLVHAGEPQLLQAARDAWTAAYSLPHMAADDTPENDVRAFYTTLTKVLSQYDFTSRLLRQWGRQVQQETHDSLARIRQLRAAARFLKAAPTAEKEENDEPAGGADDGLDGKTKTGKTTEATEPPEQLSNRDRKEGTGHHV